MSMAPTAPPGKPRCWVSEGVCLKVYDIISGPDRWQGSGVSPGAGGKKNWAFFSPSMIEFGLRRQTDRQTDRQTLRH